MDTLSGIFVPVQICHKLFALALGTEALLDTDYDRLELLSVLHEVLPPSFPLNVIQDMQLDDAACFTSSLSKVSRKFPANH